MRALVSREDFPGEAEPRGDGGDRGQRGHCLMERVPSGVTCDLIIAKFSGFPSPHAP